MKTHSCRLQPEGLISSVTTRRQIIRQAALSSGALLVGSLGLGELSPLWAALDLTESTTAGPFYKPGAPFRSMLIEGGVQGTPFLLSGRVLDPAGAVLKNAVVDLWHADSTGAYDSQGFRLRGRVRTDAEGRYSFRTIKPKFYSGRPAHFHFKVYGDDITELTTQLFFKGDALLGNDRIARSSLVLAPKDQDAGLAASFDFVVRKR
jgi:protocatechuate 3,4-dioxygenase beta subunit